MSEEQGAGERQDVPGQPPGQSRDDLNFVMKARRDKLDALVARGVPPFAYGFDRSHHASHAVSLLPDGQEEGPTVRVADRKSTRLNSSHMSESRMPSSA